jgi:hypothetical protein
MPLQLNTDHPDVNNIGTEQGLGDPHKQAHELSTAVVHLCSTLHENLSEHPNMTFVGVDRTLIPNGYTPATAHYAQYSHQSATLKSRRPFFVLGKHYRLTMV